MIEPDPVQATRHWLETIVVGLNLCPFAAPVIHNGGLNIEVSTALDPQQQMAAVLQQLDRLQQSDEDDIETSLLVFDGGLREFEQFWDIVAEADEVLEEVGLAGVIQIASFHPDYIFEGVAEDDVSHYTNRSPYPMLHFIREAHLSRALAEYPNAEQIPDNNISRLRQLGTTELLKLLAGH